MRRIVVFSSGGEFVAAMEDVLDLYEEEYDLYYPTLKGCIT